MGELWDAVGQWIISNLGWTAVIILCLLSLIFKFTKHEIDPLGWVIDWIGKGLTKSVRHDISELKAETNRQFEKIEHDRSDKIEELKSDYNDKISNLREDLDIFEDRTNKSLAEMKVGTTKNCDILKKRLDKMEKSNDSQTIRQIRAHVLSFANSCMNKVRHTKLEFDNIIDENTLYDELCKKYRIRNNVYKADYDFIIKIYKKCQEEGSFLKESDDA